MSMIPTKLNEEDLTQFKSWLAKLDDMDISVLNILLWCCKNDHDWSDICGIPALLDSTPIMESQDAKNSEDEDDE